MDTLLDRMLPYIGWVAANLSRGRARGLCCATTWAGSDGAITTTELAQLRHCIDTFVDTNGCVFVAYHLSSGDQVPIGDKPDFFVERWTRWAIATVREAQQQLYGY